MPFFEDVLRILGGWAYILWVYCPWICPVPFLLCFFLAMMCVASAVYSYHQEQSCSFMPSPSRCTDVTNPRKSHTLSCCNAVFCNGGVKGANAFLFLSLVGVDYSFEIRVFEVKNMWWLSYNFCQLYRCPSVTPNYQGIHIRVVLKDSGYFSL